MFDFLRNKRVLITGHTGFKGSWLSAWLLKLGAEVTGYALPPLTPEDHFVQLGLANRMRHIEGDLLDLPKLTATFRDARPEIVLHLAAQALVRRSYSEPKLTFDTNVTGGVNLLEAIRTTPEVRALVFVTSDKCYRNHEWVWGYRESDELGGDDPYSASKAAAELVFRSYAASFFSKRENFAAATARAGNVIGGGDFATDRIVPDCVRALRTNQPIIIRSPEATRPWQHVLEPLSGYLRLAQALFGADGRKFEGGWNFGPLKDSNRSVRELVERVIAGWGEGEMKIERPMNAPHESRLLHLNCDKAHGELAWSPTWHFAEGVDETTRWYRETTKGGDVWALTNAQIAAYEKAFVKA